MGRGVDKRVQDVDEEALVKKKSQSPAPADSPSRPGSLTLTASPISLDDIYYIVSLGWLSPPGHTFPTDHIYFYLVNPMDRQRNLYAPAAGTVISILRTTSGPPGGDYKLWIKHSEKIQTYIDHVGELAGNVLAQAGSIEPGLSKAVSIAVQAGELLGKTSNQTGAALAVDLGLINGDVTQGFINRSKYNSDTLHSDAPIPYFESGLRTQLYAKVERQGSDKDGKINYDVAGRLSGNWFGSGANDQTYSKHLAFAVDLLYPAKLRASIGGEINNGVPGRYGVQAGAMDPAKVSAATGKVAYQLYGFDPNQQGENTAVYGFMLVQLIDDNTLRVEVFPGNTGATGDFTNNAYTHTR